MRINDSRFWREHVDEGFIVEGRPITSLLRVLRSTKGRITLFIHSPRPRSVFVILSLYRLVFPDRVKVVLQELNFDFHQFLGKGLSLRRGIRRGWLSVLVASCDHIICHSTQQTEDLKVLYPNKGKAIHFVALPKGHNVSRPRVAEPEDEAPFVLVPGEVRDFGIIFRICERLERASIPIKIVGRKKAIHQQAQQQVAMGFDCKGIEVEYDLPREQYLSLLASARVVVIPTLECHRANGQLTLLDAYAFGKATVCLFGANLWDYYDEGSVATYHAGDDDELLGKIVTLWNDQEARRELKQKAFRYLHRFPTKDEFVRTIFSVCEIDP